MATPSERVPDNVPGPYYVDGSCIDCDQCHTAAPTMFSRNIETARSFVKRQPATPHDLELAEEVRGLCPNQAIGNDGA